MVDWYIKGGSTYNSILYELWTFIKNAGFDEGDYETIDFLTDSDADDPFWALGLDTQTSTKGLQQIEIGLKGGYRIKITSTGVFYWDVGLSSWITLSTGGGATDANAIHDNVASEISAISEKLAPISTDMIVIEDSENANSKKMVQIGNLPSTGINNVVEDTSPQLGGNLDCNSKEIQGITELKGSSAINLKTSGDNDDYLEFTTPSNSPVIKRIGGARIRVESDNASEVGFRIRKDSSNYIGLTFDKTSSYGKILSTHEIRIHSNGDTDDYFVFSTSGDVPIITAVGAEGLIKNIADPTDNQDVATKKYVDDNEYTDSDVEAVITAELADGESIDSAIDSLISSHAGVSNAHHEPTVAGDLNHNDLANIDADDVKHITAVQLAALHDTYTDAEAVDAVEAAVDLTFSSFPITPSAAPDADYEVANKKYVDDNSGSGGGVEDGDSFPGSPTDGDLFWHNIDEALYMYDDTAEAWIQVGGGGLGGGYPDIINVSDESQLQAAIDTGIGSSDGTISIVEDFAITSQIDVDGGGSYIIDGQGHTLTIDAGVTAFDITAIKKLTLKNIDLNCSAYATTTPAIIVDEASDNEVYIEKLKITLATYQGYGIDIDSDYVTVRDCIINGGLNSIDCSGNFCTIENNRLSNVHGGVTTQTDVFCLTSSGTNNCIQNNRIKTVSGGFPGSGTSGYPGGDATAIYNTGINCRILNNCVDNINGGNAMHGGTNGGAGGLTYGMRNTGDYSVVIGNTVEDINGSQGGNGTSSGGLNGYSYGIHNTGTNCTIGNNTLNDLVANDGPYDPSGNPGGYIWGIYNNGALTSIIGNTVENVLAGKGGDTNDGPGGYAYAIVNAAASVTITGNTIENITGGLGDDDAEDNGAGGHAYGIYNSGNYCSIGDNVMNTLTGGAAGGGGGTADVGGNAYGIINYNNTDCVINNNQIYNLVAGTGGAGSGSVLGLDDTGTADYNIYTCNNCRGYGEDVNDGSNSILANNLT